MVRPYRESLVAEKVVVQVQEMIREGAYGPGERLPAERELATRPGVSRPSLRVGIQLLNTIGLIESRP